MDTKKVLHALFEVIVESDPAYQEETRQTLKATEPHYQRLCQALGEEEADQFWTALLCAGGDQQDCVFRVGLCLGLRLMALCL